MSQFIKLVRTRMRSPCIRGPVPDVDPKISDAYAVYESVSILAKHYSERYPPTHPESTHATGYDISLSPCDKEHREGR